jgi:hypothetical protein
VTRREHALVLGIALAAWGAALAHGPNPMYRPDEVAFRLAALDHHGAGVLGAAGIAGFFPWFWLLAFALWSGGRALAGIPGAAAATALGLLAPSVVTSGHTLTVGLPATALAAAAASAILSRRWALAAPAVLALAVVMEPVFSVNLRALVGVVRPVILAGVALGLVGSDARVFVLVAGALAAAILRAELAVPILAIAAAAATSGPRGRWIAPALGIAGVAQLALATDSPRNTGWILADVDDALDWLHTAGAATVATDVEPPITTDLLNLRARERGLVLTFRDPAAFPESASSADSASSSPNSGAPSPAASSGPAASADPAASPDRAVSPAPATADHALAMLVGDGSPDKAAWRSLLPPAFDEWKRGPLTTRVWDRGLLPESALTAGTVAGHFPANQALYVRLSDGTTRGPLLQPASSATVVHTTAGWLAFYVRDQQIWRARSGNGIAWEDEHPLGIPGFDPALQELPGGGWTMYVAELAGGPTDVDPATHPTNIVSYHSLDLASFEREPGIVLSGTGVVDPSPLRTGNELALAYTVERRAIRLAVGANPAWTLDGYTVPFLTGGWLVAQRPVMRETLLYAFRLDANRAIASRPRPLEICGTGASIAEDRVYFTRDVTAHPCGAPLVLDRPTGLPWDARPGYGEPPRHEPRVPR